MVRYLSLFSGIGCFEYALQKVFPESYCVAYSEIDPYAIKIYNHHYPDHHNIGDITKLSKKQIKRLGRIDLVFGGFPCTNLSSMTAMRGNHSGLAGPKSGLFYNMLKVLEWTKKYNPDVKFIIENNNSMKKMWKDHITEQLSKLYTVNHIVLNNADFGVQSRKRIIWTNFPIQPPNQNLDIQTWTDVLEPYEDVLQYRLTDKMINCLNSTYSRIKSTQTKIAVKNSENRYEFIYKKDIGRSRWDIHSRSDNMSVQQYTYPIGKSRPITSGVGGGNNVILDRRGGPGFIPRRFTMVELERLFGLPDGYTDVGLSNTRRHIALGNSVPIFIVKYVFQTLT